MIHRYKVAFKLKDGHIVKLDVVATSFGEAVAVARAVRVLGMDDSVMESLKVTRKPKITRTPIS